MSPGGAIDEITLATDIGHAWYHSKGHDLLEHVGQLVTAGKFQ